MRATSCLIIHVLALLFVSAPAATADAQAQRWDFSIASGFGAREVDGSGFSVPYVGFWATRERSENTEVVYEIFLLTPTTKTTGPRPIGFAPDLHMSGTSTYTVRDIAIGTFGRLNYYLGDGPRARPYVTIGGGFVFWNRARERRRTTWTLPDGAPVVEISRDHELLPGINSVIGFGVKVEMTDGWYIRPEGRLPIPFLPPPALGHPANSIAFVVGITYSPWDR